MLTSDQFLPSALRIWAAADPKGWLQNPERLRELLRQAAAHLESGYPPSPYQQGYDEAMIAGNQAGYVGFTPAQTIELLSMLTDN